MITTHRPNLVYNQFFANDFQQVSEFTQSRGRFKNLATFVCGALNQVVFVGREYSLTHRQSVSLIRILNETQKIWIQVYSQYRRREIGKTPEEKKHGSHLGTCGDPFVARRDVYLRVAAQG